MTESQRKSSPELTRRRFVAVFNGIWIPFVAPPLLSCTTSTADLDIAIIENFSYLKLDPAGVSKFTSTYQELNGRKEPKFPAIFLQYLMSTDFFAYQQDESRVIMFSSFYDPERVVCNNPFAMLS